MNERTRSGADGSARPGRRAGPLLFTVFVVATAGLVYELVAGTVGSYLLGDSVVQFSLTIGIYLFAMGIGSLLSRFVERDVARRFVEVELGTALFGGFSAPLLFLAFPLVEHFGALLYGLLLVVGTLVGLEIPLLMRILRDEVDFRDLVARVLGFDYLGALFASVLFALFFVPRLGLQRTSLFFGLLNALVALLATHVLAEQIRPRVRLGLRVAALLLAAALAAGLWWAGAMQAVAEAAFYQEPIVHAERTPYQRIVLTHRGRRVRLYLDGHLQFDSHDERRYHEALVHPAMAAVRPAARRILLLGAGDGLALRELWRHPDIEQVVMVELDPAMARLARSSPWLRRLNEGSLDDPRLHLVEADAFVWLGEPARRDEPPFDVAVVDFPDPRNYALGKLYSRAFYQRLRRVLRPDGVLVVQSTSPLEARHAFWSVVRTLQAAGFHTLPYRRSVPSFGVWGYVLASPRAVPRVDPARFPPDLRTLDGPSWRAMTVFPPDMAAPRPPPPVQRLDDQALVRLYLEDWSN